MTRKEQTNSCSQCRGPKIDLTKSMCESCREKRREKAKKQAEKRRDKAVCVCCGGSSDRLGRQCSKCLDKYYIRTANESRRISRLNLCPSCGINKAEEVSVPETFREQRPRTLNCTACREEIRDRNVEQRHLATTLMGGCCVYCNNTNLTFLTIIPKEPMSTEDAFTFWHMVLAEQTITVSNRWVIPLLRLPDLEEAKEKYEVACFNCYAIKKINGRR